MALFDVYLGKVYFDNEIDYKYRPILQANSNPNADNAFAVITSNTSRKSNGEILILDFKDAGLKNLSTARLSKRLNNPSSKIHIGRLSKNDQLSIIKGLRENYKIEKHKTEDLDDDFDIDFPILIEVKYD